LLIPLVGFLPPDDPRVVGTVEAVRAELGRDGDFIRRYSTDESLRANRVDGGAFGPPRPCAHSRKGQAPIMCTPPST
ncbi:hypothetical protein, partial [Streptomyces sp. NPDC048442]|uniref:hypothetical protein n=1 Tax=Streptomyces sp. NPDC048442 TaxID=3154823 RepID=UPI0034191575